MKTGILVPVRANNSRFPGKFTKKLVLPNGAHSYGAPDYILGMRLQHFFPDVLRYVVYPEDAPVSTTRFFEFAAPAHGRDVMSQLAVAVRELELDIVILINGDRPLCFLDQCRKAYLDYWCNFTTEEYDEDSYWTDEVTPPIVVGDGPPGTGWAIMPAEAITNWARYLTVLQEHAYGALTSKEAAWAPKYDIRYVDLGGNHDLALDIPLDAQRLATVCQGLRYTPETFAQASSEAIMDATYWAISSYPELWGQVTN